jgi:hypothetical protein
MGSSFFYRLASKSIVSSAAIAKTERRCGQAHVFGTSCMHVHLRLLFCVAFCADALACNVLSLITLTIIL